MPKPMNTLNIMICFSAFILDGIQDWNISDVPDDSDADSDFRPADQQQGADSDNGTYRPTTQYY